MRIKTIFKLTFLFIFVRITLCGSGIASWYADRFENKTTASGYIYNSKQLTCASNKHPFGTVLKVTNINNNKSVIVVVTDRGAFDIKYGRDIDLSKKAFSKIDNIHKGLTKVKIEVIDSTKTFKYKHGRPHFKYEDYVGGQNWK